MQNFKNCLQEKFQKIGLGLPKYDYRKTNVGWISTVELCNGSVFTGSELPTKVGSDQDAARQALTYYEGHLAEFHTEGLLDQVLCMNSWKGVDEPSRIWIVIDLENIGDEKQMIKLKELKKHGFIVSGYASSGYRNVEKIKKYLPDQSIHIDESDQSESADMRIMVDVTHGLMEDDFGLIFIISYDKFANAAIGVFNKLDEHYNPSGTRLYNCRTVDQVLMELKL